MNEASLKITTYDLQSDHSAIEKNDIRNTHDNSIKRDNTK